MTYKALIEQYVADGLIKRQKSNTRTVEGMLIRSAKDLNTAKANLDIDEGVAYSVAYLAMLRAGRAYMLLRGFRPSDGYQHKTVVDFMGKALGEEYKNIVERFDRMRRKRNIFTYEIDIIISRTEAENALETAAKFVDLMRGIIRKESPQSHFEF